MIGARDVQATIDYWCDQLGFECPAGVIAGVGDEPAIYAVLRRNGAELHVQIRRHAIWGDDRNPVERSAYFYVGDVNTLNEEFMAKGAKILQAPTQMPYGMREMVVEDPEGHRIAFGSDPSFGDLSIWRAAPILGTRDVEATTTWFCDALGFECPGGVFRPVAEAVPVYAIVLREDAGIHLQIRHRAVFPIERETIEGDAYVFVDDVDTLNAEYAAREDVSLQREVMDEPYGLRDFTVASPDGHRIAFGTPL